MWLGITPNGTMQDVQRMCDVLPHEEVKGKLTRPLSLHHYPSNNIIYLECEGRLEKSVPRIAVWHHEACRVMTNGDPEEQFFLSYPHTNNGLFFLLNTVIIYLFILK